nr:hypothetical protein [Oceanobacillus sp. J11TS1]
MNNHKRMKTRSWIKRNARPLENARWEFLFENGSRERVVHYLSAFQNSDGGFGHGLEPDLGLPQSSAIATWSAGQILMEIQAEYNEEIVRRMIDYLIQSYDKELGLWKTVTPEHNDFPHAPHWHFEEGAQDIWMFNPSAELAAFLIHWTPEGSEGAKLGWEVVEKAKVHLLNSNKMGFHEVNNYQMLIRILGDKLNQFQEIEEKVNDLAGQAIDTDPNSWGKSYNALPLDLIHSKKDKLYEKYKDLVDENIEYLERSLKDDGVWDITWNWEEDPENFFVAKQQWKGIIAVNNYKKLQNFS